MRRVIVSMLVFSALLGVGGDAWATGGAPDLAIEGNRFVGDGSPTRLLGVNITGPEFVCAGPLYSDYYKQGVWAYPVGDAAVAAMAAWKINAVRIPLNEDCWLGINPVTRTGEPSYTVKPAKGAAARKRAQRAARHYRSEIRAFVRRLHARGLYAILDLHWTAPGSLPATGQYPLPDRDHSVAFWKSVATAFKADRSTVFELFNEPMLSNTKTYRDDLTWSCLRDGCVIPNRCADCEHPKVRGRYRTAGFQRLVDTIRHTGARNPILVSGRFYSSDLSRWLEFMPRDPLRQIGAVYHGYDLPPCAGGSCWTTTLAEIAKHVPVTATEFGHNEGDEPCTSDIAWDDRLMTWADGAGAGYLAWVWWNLDDQYDDPRPKCSLGMLLDEAGTPRPGHGQAVHDHFAALSAAQGGGRVH